MSQAFSQKLTAFRQKCQQILGPKRQGYGELSQLEQPLVSGNDSDDAYFRAHGVRRPGSTQQGTTDGGLAVPHDIGNLQTQELQDLIDLGRDAADILWEMAALQEETVGTKDVLDNVKVLQARLRGMLSDYKEGNEQTLAQAFEIFDRLSNSLSEYDTAMSPRAGDAPQSAPGFSTTNVSSGYPASNTQRPASIPPPRHEQNPFQPGNTQTAPGAKAPAEEAPLISFD